MPPLEREMPVNHDLTRILLKLPIALLGSWFHEIHGVIKFTQADFDALVCNFKNNARGYEPYVRYGHHEKGAGIMQGERALAHMVDVKQEGDCLWGYFEPHNFEVVSEVERGEYRYISPEYIRNAKDRNTNEGLGPILLGLALTNSPSIPWLPRNSVIHNAIVSALSDDYELTNRLILMHPKDTMILESSEHEAAEERAIQAIADSIDEHRDQSTKEEERLHGEIAEVLSAVKDHQTSSATKDAENTRVLDGIRWALEQMGEKFSKSFELIVSRLESLVAKEDDEQLMMAEGPVYKEEEVLTMSDNAKVSELAAELEEARRLAKEAQAALEQKELESQQASAELAAQKLAAEDALRQALAEAKEKELVSQLSDKVRSLVASGVPPAAAEKAKNLILALQGTETVLLSDQTVDLADAVFDLLSDRAGEVQFGQIGSEAAAAIPQAENPWGSHVAKLKAQAAK